MIKCNYCGLEKDDGLKVVRKFCNDCVKDKEIGVIKSLEYENLAGYGKVLKSRLRELDRRVVLPYKKGTPGSGEYYLGRMGENGKVQEKHPNYH